MEQETKPTPATNGGLFIPAITLSAVTVAGLFITGLLKWIAWPVVFYILKATLVTSLIGMVGGSLLEARRKTKNRPLKALLILTTLGCIVVFAAVSLALDNAKPEMRPVEERIFNTLVIFTGFAGLSIFELRALLTGQTYEPPEDSRVKKMLKKAFKPLLEKPRMTQDLLLIGGGISMLLVALVIYHTSDADTSNPDAFWGLGLMGINGIILGIETRLEARHPRLAKGLILFDGMLIIVAFYFFIRLFIYG